MADICESRVPLEQLEAIKACDACHTSFVTHTSGVSTAASHSLVATVRYQICLHARGFGLGRHLYSLTLVPGEEVELEVFRFSRVEEELSKELSTEESFSQELFTSIQKEWSNRESSNTKVSSGAETGVLMDIIGVGMHDERQAVLQEETFQSGFRDFAARARAQVDRRFDIHMDLKSETVASTRSTRRVRNFNRCQPVTYNYFQLMRRLRLEVLVDSLTFDITRQPHPLLTQRTRAILHTASFTPPRAREILAAIPTPAHGLQITDQQRTLAGLPPVAAVAEATVQHPIIADDFNHPARQLSLEQLALLPLEPAVRRAALKLAGRLQGRFPAGKVVFAQDLCVNTTGVTCEAFTGRCLACDTHVALVDRAEDERMRNELMGSKLEGLRATVHGFVRTPAGTPAGAVAGAVVRLSREATVLGETVTDADGLYVFPWFGLAETGQELTVEVVTLPPGLASVSPGKVNFTVPAASDPVQIHYVASGV